MGFGLGVIATSYFLTKTQPKPVAKQAEEHVKELLKEKNIKVKK